jgi:hypothetical protein
MDIKMLADGLKIPVPVVHPRRPTGGRTPTFQDLRGSAALGADASAVIVLHRPLIGSEGQEEADATRRPLGFLRVDAHRFGSGGVRRVFFDTETFTFREPTEGEIIEHAPKQGRGTVYPYRGNGRAEAAAGGRPRISSRPNTWRGEGSASLSEGALSEVLPA